MAIHLVEMERLGRMVGWREDGVVECAREDVVLNVDAEGCVGNMGGELLA